MLFCLVQVCAKTKLYDQSPPSNYSAHLIYYYFFNFGALPNFLHYKFTMSLQADQLLSTTKLSPYFQVS